MSEQSEADQSVPAASSGVTPEALKVILVRELDATKVYVTDMSGGCGQMFEALIVSPQFAKKTTLMRHRLVNNTLKTEIAAIHAWTPKCFTPDEWERRKSEFGYD